MAELPRGEQPRSASRRFTSFRSFPSQDPALESAEAAAAEAEARAEAEAAGVVEEELAELDEPAPATDEDAVAEPAAEGEPAAG